jgi:hypothetical protein
VTPVTALGCVIPLTGALVGLPFTPLAVGLFGLIGWLGLVGMTGVPGVTAEEAGSPAEGVVPVPLGAVVAPGAVGVETPAPEVPPAAVPPDVPAAAWPSTGREAVANRQNKPVIFLINHRRS